MYHFWHRCVKNKKQPFDQPFKTKVQTNGFESNKAGFSTTSGFNDEKLLKTEVFEGKMSNFVFFCVFSRNEKNTGFFTMNTLDMAPE
jgi:hypothetical protein